jgi:hypothetical protein
MRSGRIWKLVFWPDKSMSKRATSAASGASKKAATKSDEQRAWDRVISELKQQSCGIVFPNERFQCATRGGTCAGSNTMHVRVLRLSH